MRQEQGYDKLVTPGILFIRAALKTEEGGNAVFLSESFLKCLGCALSKHEL